MPDVSQIDRTLNSPSQRIRNRVLANVPVVIHEAQVQEPHRDGLWRKRVFDCTVTLAAAPLWVPALLICATLILLLEGRPVFYVSRRQIGLDQFRRIMKFRTMRRNADKLLNRDTVPVTDKVFLNIPTNSEVYTPVGRLIERCALTELPQLLHVLSGKMSLIGSRPLPDRVMEVLRAAYPKVDDRFLTKAGLSGPVQLIGRDTLSDAERLDIETEYCRIAASGGYSIRLDLWLLLYTVYAVIVPGRLLTLPEVRRKLRRLSGDRPFATRRDTRWG